MCGYSSENEEKSQRLEMSQTSQFTPDHLPWTPFDLPVSLPYSYSPRAQKHSLAFQGQKHPSAKLQQTHSVSANLDWSVKGSSEAVYWGARI